MATFVIVHGGWGGGWEWTPVARALRQRGHEVFTPTLTGMGEREHIRASEITLPDHIDDVLAALEFEELSDVILCGHSYGGMVVTGVADRAPGRVRLLVYLDALIPRDGQSVQDLMPAEVVDALLEAAKGQGDGGIPIPPDMLPPEGAIANETRARYIARIRPHPLATLTGPVHLSGAVDRLPRAYVHCTVEGEMMAPFVERAKSEGWHYREIACAHDLHLMDPEGTVEILDGLAKVPV